MKKVNSVYWTIWDVNRLNYLVRIRQSSHACHDTENVVVHSIDTELSGVRTENRRVQVQEQSGVINSRHVDGSAGLMLLWVQSERIDVDTNLFRDTGVMLIRLYECKVSSLSGGESVLTIELKLSINNGVRTVVVRVVRPFVSSSVGIRLNNPDKLFARMVKSELALDSSAGV